MINRTALSTPVIKIYVRVCVYDRHSRVWATVWQGHAGPGIVRGCSKKSTTLQRRRIYNISPQTL